MGNWNLNIKGVGCHHNGKPYDVESFASDFVKQLMAAGHTVQEAYVTFPGSTIKDVELLPVKAEQPAA